MAATAYSPHPIGARRPVPGLSVLTHMSAGLLALPVVTDYAYLQTTVLMWKDFSSWLLFFGLIVAGVGCVLWLINQPAGSGKAGHDAGVRSTLENLAHFIENA